MESPAQLEDGHFVVDSAEPFKGVVVCCTSIPPETRTEIAQKVTDLGGVHKYDLTPDVTHLIVGDYDTPKYRHVARERQDIRAMDAAWIDAVSQLWKDDESIDFLTLEKEHTLKALETNGSTAPAQNGEPGSRQSLLVCLTGFGLQRDEIAQKILENGGRHTDDLTRRCTHLIVSKPEGKKFTAAKSWNIRTVTLDWLDQSAARGMILEEEKFDPLLPKEQQGVGAWIKKDLRRQSLGKRTRSAVGGAEEGTRKLRKTASMKLSSQRNNLWGDILGRSDSREYSFKADNQPEEPTQRLDLEHEKPHEPPPPAIPVEQGIFSDCIFHIHGFSDQRTKVLSQTIEGLDGKIASTLFQATESSLGHRFVIVPQSSQPDSHPTFDPGTINIVTEFYIEKCLHNRQFFPPGEHHSLGRPFPSFPIPGFSDITICTAAFTGIELSQVARSVAQLGAKFEEQFRRSTSVLVCKSLDSIRKDKLRAALSWGVPVVSADWLWECISTGYKVPTEDFIFPGLRDRLQNQTPSTKQLEKSTKRPIQRTHSEPVTKATKAAKQRSTGFDPSAFEHDSPEKEVKPRRLPVPQEDSILTADFNTAHTHPAPNTFDPPLSELSAASLNKSPSPSKTAAPQRAKSEPAPKEDQPQEDLAPADTPAGPVEEKTEESESLAAKAAERQVLTTKLTSLLSSTTPTASTENLTDPQQQQQQQQQQQAIGRPRRRQILGRAISNASAGSSASAAPSADTRHNENEEEQQPPATQIEYFDPEARDHKAALMDRMMGGSGDLGKKPQSTASTGVIGGRSLRKR